MLEKLRRCGWLICIGAIAAGMLLIGENRPEYEYETDIEARLRQVLSSVDGAGNVQLLVNEAQDGGIIGVCVVTSAADDVAAVFRIQRAVSTALGIDNERIEVIRMEEEAE